VLKRLIREWNSLLLVARVDQQPFGFVSLHFIPYFLLEGEEAYVSELFVHNSFADKGVGSALLEAAVEAARTRKCKRMHLINSRVRESYKRGFYSKRGWREREYAASFCSI